MGYLEDRFQGHRRSGEIGVFSTILLVLAIATVFGITLYLKTIKNLPELEKKESKRTVARFTFAPATVKKVPPKPKKPIEKKKKVEKKKKKKTPPKPILKKKAEPKVTPQKKPAEKQVVKPRKAPRKIYGNNRSYSNGLGSGGAMSDAVVGKVGNTLNKKYDDIKATKDDLKGEVVSKATVTKAPSFKRRATPVITEEMKKNSIEGTIKVRVLVDIDGKVKKAIAKNDLGFGTKKAALDACYKMLFSPARRDGKNVAVWIVIPVRFVKIS